MSPKTIVAIVLSVATGGTTFFWGLNGTTVTPGAAAPEVCAMVRPELVQRLFPGYGPAVPQSEEISPGFRAAGCEWKSPDHWVWAAVVRYGHTTDRGGPDCGTWIAALPINRRNHPVALGEKASYYVVPPSDENEEWYVSLTACLGSYGVHAIVTYPEAAGQEATVGAVQVLTQEVLSQL